MPEAGPPPTSIDDTGDDGLPRSIFVPQSDPRKDMRDVVDSVLSDSFMAFLSVLLIPIILLPLFINLPALVLSFLDICDTTIVIFFVAEYVSKLYLAENRWDFFKSSWHLVDLAVVLLSFVSYLPLIGLQGRGSTALLLRLIRLPRALAVGGRTAGSRMKTVTVGPAVPLEVHPTVIRWVEADMRTEHDGLTWDDVEKHLATREQEWIDIHNITEEGVSRLSGALRVPPHHFKVKEIDEVYPHVDSVQQMSFIFLQSGEITYPKQSERFLTISRFGETIVCSGPKIISASPHGEDMFKRSLQEMQANRGEHSFTVSVLYGILDTALREYRSLFSEIEVEIGRISGTPRSRLPKDFLQRMYDLNRQVVRLVSNLVHFKQVLGAAISGRLRLEGFDEGAKEDLQRLLDDATYLNDIADEVVDNIHTIIELYINQSSFETNRILKILAVITSLSVIPSALAGILGMNILGVPYEFTLWEVVLVIVMSMTFVGYCFYKLGWLRT